MLVIFIIYFSLSSSITTMTIKQEQSIRIVVAARSAILRIKCLGGSACSAKL
jgi:hypothetical protein